MKIKCIIDACSCIYLSNAEFSQKDLLYHLDQVADLKFSSEVKKELFRQGGSDLPTFLRKDKYLLKPTKIKFEDYHKKFLGETLPSGRIKGSRGEVDNFILAINQVHHLKLGSMIYITDDSKALNGFLEKWSSSFPGIQYWTSYDVLLFLYAIGVIPNEAIAKDLLRDLNSAAKKQEGISEKLNESLQKIIAQMHQKIDKISRIIN